MRERGAESISADTHPAPARPAKGERERGAFYCIGQKMALMGKLLQGWRRARREGRERGVISTPLKCKTASADRFGPGLPATGGVQTAHSREMAKTARPLVDWLSGYKVAEKRTPHDMGQKGTAPVPPLVMTDEVLNVTLEGRMNVRELLPH